MGERVWKWWKGDKVETELGDTGAKHRDEPEVTEQELELADSGTKSEDDLEVTEQELELADSGTKSEDELEVTEQELELADTGAKHRDELEVADNETKSEDDLEVTEQELELADTDTKSEDELEVTEQELDIVDIKNDEELEDEISEENQFIQPGDQSDDQSEPSENYNKFEEDAKKENLVNIVAEENDGCDKEVVSRDGEECVGCRAEEVHECSQDMPDIVKKEEELAAALQKMKLEETELKDLGMFEETCKDEEVEKEDEVVELEEVEKEDAGVEVKEMEDVAVELMEHLVVNQEPEAREELPVGDKVDEEEKEDDGTIAIVEAESCKSEIKSCEVVEEVEEKTKVESEKKPDAKTAEASRRDRVEQYLGFMKLWVEVHGGQGEAAARREGNLVWRSRVERGEGVSLPDYLEQMSMLRAALRRGVLGDTQPDWDQTEFLCYGAETSVEVAGSFNSWLPAPLARSGEEWAATFPLPPGRHLYKYVVDGEWLVDPGKQVVIDEKGNENNVVEVEDRLTKALGEMAEERARLARVQEAPWRVGGRGLGLCPT